MRPMTSPLSPFPARPMHLHIGMEKRWIRIPRRDFRHAPGVIAATLKTGGSR